VAMSALSDFAPSGVASWRARCPIEVTSALILLRRLICRWHMAAGQLAVFQGATRPQRFAQPRPHRYTKCFGWGCGRGDEHI
jgi:hypothetical protein